MIRLGKFGWKRIIFSVLLLATLAMLSVFFYSETERKSKTDLILSSMGSRNTADFVKPSIDTTIIGPYRNSLTTCNKAFMVIIVSSHGDNIARRNSIRETWAKWQTEYNSVVFFFTGATKTSNKDHLEAEANLYGDVIVDELEDHKYKLTVKTLRLLKWHIKNCPRAEFLLKVDDDAFLNLPVMNTHLQNLNTTVLSKGYIGGLIHEGRVPHDRNPFSKWYVPPEMWEAGTIYPPYIDSLCIVFSGKIVSHIFMASLNTPLFHISEIFITGIVASTKLEMELSDIPSMYDGQWPVVNYFFLKSVEFIQTNIAYHCNGDFNLMRKLYTNSRSVNNENVTVIKG